MAPKNQKKLNRGLRIADGRRSAGEKKGFRCTGVYDDVSPRIARVLIAEDDAILRYTLRLIVEEHHDVVREAMNGQEAVDLCQQLQPDIVLLDISMPCLSGIEAARRIRTSVL